LIYCLLEDIFGIVLDAFAFGDWGKLKFGLSHNEDVELIFDSASEKLGSKRRALEWLDSPLIGTKTPNQLIEEGRTSEVLNQLGKI